MLSNPGTPVTPTSSHAARRDSTQPSSPMTGVDQDVEMVTVNGRNGDQGKKEESAAAVEDEEDMDVKAKALMHLLNTSEVRNPRKQVFFQKAGLFSS